MDGTWLNYLGLTKKVTNALISNFYSTPPPHKDKLLKTILPSKSGLLLIPGTAPVF